MHIDSNIPFKRNRPLHLMIFLFAGYWGTLAISPHDRTLWWMENVLLIATVITLTFTYKRLRLSNLSYFLIFLFLCIHTYAAHYTYQNIPVDNWLKSVVHTERSYFDRFVHFLFGCMWIYPAYEIVSRAVNRRGVWLAVFALSVIFSLSALFEIIEMLVAIIPENAGQQYVGLQGDIFDSQKDMALALLGGLLVATIIVINENRRRRSLRQNQIS